MPVMTKLSGLQRAARDAAARHLLLLLEHGFERRAGVDAEGLDLQLALLGGPARAVLQRRDLGGELAGQADARAGHRVLGEPPADLLLARLDGGGERRALLRAHHAGDRILVPRLVGLHRRDQPLAEFAVDRAGEVAAPGQIVLDRHAVGRAGSRHRCPAGPTAWRAACRRRRCRWSAGLAVGLAVRGLGFRLGRRRRAWLRRFAASASLGLAWLGLGFRLGAAAVDRRRDWPADRPARAPPNSPAITAKIAAKTRIRTPKRHGAAP